MQGFSMFIAMNRFKAVSYTHLDVYKRQPLGSALKRHFAGWNCYLLSADMRLPKLMRLTPGKKTLLYNGAIECRLFEFKMVAGSNRR